MPRIRAIISLIGLLAICAAGHAQVLGRDAEFPIFQHLRWDMTLADARDVGTKLGIIIRSTDSSITYKTPAFGFTAQTNLQFNSGSRTPTVMQVLFPEPKDAVVDSLVTHFTRLLGKEPAKASQEKSMLIFTVRFEIFAWKTADLMISINRALRGSTLMSASLVLTPVKPPAVNEKSSPPHK